jgi:signal transduction histidine kinase
MHLFSTIVIVVFLIFSTTIFAQKQIADSLINVLHTQKLTPADQLVLYHDICDELIKSDMIELGVYAKKGLSLAEKEKNELMILKFNQYTGISYAVNGIYDQSLVYLEHALTLAQEIKAEDEEASILSNLANVYNIQFQQEKALPYYLKALSIFEKYKDRNHQMQTTRILINIAQVHITLNNYDRAIYYLKQAEVLAEALNTPYEMSLVYINLGAVYFDKGMKDLSLMNLLKGLEICRSNGIRGPEIDALTTITQIYAENAEEYDKAEEYGNEALRLAEEYNNLPAIARTRLTLASVYLKQKRYKECDEFASIAYELDSVNTLSKITAAEYIIEASIFLGNQAKEASFFQKYKNFVKQSNDESLHKSLSEMEVKYETGKKELQISALEKEKTLYIWIGIIGGTLFLSLIFLFIIFYRLMVRNRKLAEQQQQIIATQSALDGETSERIRLARDLHDGLGGMLSVLKIHLNDAENARTMLDQSINELHRVAHHLMPQSLMRDGLKTALEDFCKSIPNTKFQYLGKEELLDDRTKTLMYRCAYELVNNAFKYAKASIIDIHLLQDSDSISLTVEDDGVGFDPDTVTSGMGLENLRTRIAAFNGEINIFTSPGKGTEVLVELSLNKN